MASETKPINKPLIVFSTILMALLVILGDENLLPTEPIQSLGEFTALYIIILILILPITLWFKALWNEIVPRIFNIRAVSYWEALGLSALLGLLFV